MASRIQNMASGRVLQDDFAKVSYWPNPHRIGLRENLQDPPIFDGKNHGFRLRFSKENQSNESPQSLVFPVLLYAQKLEKCPCQQFSPCLTP